MYDGDQVLWPPYDSKIVASENNCSQTTPTAIRYCDIMAPKDYSLREVLEIADDEFENIARITGTFVVTHSWGLFKAPAPTSINDMYIRRGQLPRHYLLAAEVEVIRNIRKLTADQKSDLEQVGSDYYSSEQRRAGLTWTDLSANQFINGKRQGELTERTWLVDIEPFFYPAAPFISDKRMTA